MSNYETRELEKSGRNLAPGARLIGPYPPGEQIEITIRLKSGVSEDFKKRVPKADEIGHLPLRERRYLNREEFETLYQVSPSDHTAVLEFGAKSGLILAGACGANRQIKFRGSVAELEKAFGVTLFRHSYRFGEYRGYVGKLSVPIEVWGSIEAVFGLDNRKQSKPILQGKQSAAPGITSSLLDKVIERYGFPQDWNGKGETIGILEFGGQFLPDDYSTYFQNIGMKSPSIKPKAVGIGNISTTSPREDEEVALDVEVAGTVAPGASIIVYFASNTDKGWVDALCGAIYDMDNKPAILSISWGNTENWWEQDKRDVLNQLLQEAAQLGITVCAASGDDGCAPNKAGQIRVTFPASSPYLLACGGTAFQSDKIEVVWNDGAHGASGGGESDVIDKPKWQTVDVPPPLPRPTKHGRLLPDVSGLAARRYSIYSGGGYVNGVGGTSAVAPLWAGLIARLNEALQKRVGYFNPLLYDPAKGIQKTFTDVFSGDNSVSGIIGYSAAKDWDACTGWGTPNGQKLLDALKA